MATQLDGRVWKERISAANVMRRTNLPLMKGEPTGDSEAASETRSRPPLPNRMTLPSISAPEHNLVNLLEECKSSGILWSFIWCYLHWNSLVVFQTSYKCKMKMFVSNAFQNNDFCKLGCTDACHGLGGVASKNRTQVPPELGECGACSSWLPRHNIYESIKTYFSKLILIWKEINLWMSNPLKYSKHNHIQLNHSTK